MEAIVPRDEVFATAMAAREPAFEALVKSVNEEIRNAAELGRTCIKWDIKDHPDILWDYDIGVRLEKQLTEAGYDVCMSYASLSLFYYYNGCTIEWSEKKPETKEEAITPVEEPKKRKWGRKNK